MQKAYPIDGKIKTEYGTLYLAPADVEYLTDLLNTTLIEILPEVLVEGELVPKTERILEQLKAIASIELLSLLDKVNPEAREKLLSLPVEKRKEIAYQIIKGEKGLRGLFYIFYDNETTPKDGEYEIDEYVPIFREEDIAKVEDLIKKLEES